MNHNNKRLQHLINIFYSKIEKWQSLYPNLSFVYNQQLRSIDVNNIKYILVADNPGKYEKKFNKYLIGESGLAARCFFKSELCISDFDKEILVLNKTPIFSESTEDLLKYYEGYEDVLIETQEYMSELIWEIHQILKCKVFIVGFSGCRKIENNSIKWIVKDHADKRSLPYFFSKLKQLYGNIGSADFNNLFLFKHFSMMQFFRDIVQSIGYENYADNLEEEILKLGEQYRKELIGR